MTRQKKTNSDLANMAQATIKGRAADSGTGQPVDLTSEQLGIILSPVDYITWDTTYTGTGLPAGSVQWNPDRETLDLVTANDVTLQIGEEMWFYAINQSGTDIPDGAVVMFAGGIGSSGKIKCQLAVGDGSVPATYIMGVATHAIANGASGKVTFFGEVRKLNTNSYTVGDLLYVDPATPGGLTKTEPTAPNLKYAIATVVVKSATVGEIFVRAIYSQALSELNDTTITTPQNQDLLQYNATSKAWKNVTNLALVTLDPTGFSDPSAVIINYDATTQKVTLTGSWVAYWRGQVITALTSGWVSAAHTNTTGHIYRLYYDGTNFTWLTDTDWPSFSVVMIVSVNYGASDKYAIRECHGLMNWQAHEVFHETIGTYRESGGVLGSWVAASTTAGDRRPTVTATTIHDEDIITVNPALTSDLYTQMKLAGAAVTTYTVDAAEIVPVLAANPYYNLFSTPNWTQVLMANNSYMCVWLVAMPVTASAASQKYRYLWVQGQSNTISLATQQALTPSDLNLGTLAAEATEFVFIAKVIIRYTGGNWDITSVTSLTGNKFTQVGSPAGAYLSAVAVDATLTGDGTISSPLHVVGGSIIYQRNLAAALSLANGECLVVAGYINASTYSIALSGDARLEIL